MPELTAKYHKVFEFIDRFTAKYGYERSAEIAKNTLSLIAEMSEKFRAQELNERIRGRFN